jgi:2-keto-4-pentenoate hydratase
VLDPTVKLGQPSDTELVIIHILATIEVENGIMTPEDVARAATLLVEARGARAAVVDLGARVGRPTPADAYAIQARVTAGLGAIGAWKTGAPSPTAEPIGAPIPTALMSASPVSLKAAGCRLLGVEAEIAYRLGDDLIARDLPYTTADVALAIDAVLPAIEVVDSRLNEPEASDPLWKLADHQANGALVVGAPVTAWRAIDPDLQPVRLTIDGRLAAEGVGGNPAGDPLRLIAWLANHLAGHCGGLRRGQIITTGSLTGLIWVEPGAVVTAELAGLGRVEVSFPP